jgi:hypothetical protein
VRFFSKNGQKNEKVGADVTITLLEESEASAGMIF